MTQPSAAPTRGRRSRVRSVLAAGLPLLILAALERPELTRVRHADSRPNNLASAAHVVSRGACPGDAVVFLPARTRAVEIAYPDAFERTDDVALAEAGPESATLRGVLRPLGRARAELVTHPRVWWIGRPGLTLHQDEPYALALRSTLRQRYTMTTSHNVRGLTVALYARR